MELQQSVGQAEEAKQEEERKRQEAEQRRIAEAKRKAEGNWPRCAKSRNPQTCGRNRKPG
ncbi:MAG TPA: hypothetical protein EYG15_01220 [Deltaproteobacteria bacterium]|nr:hypothetical protein [Candidatus Lambdaproteobacteria bacterium]HIL14716.1 hypothetical protein [Deltaproteobacteria bacterium]